MKKYFSIFMVAMLLIMASCSESDSPAMADMRLSDNIVNTDDAVPYDQAELAAVFAALDSLNATVPDNVGRGFWGGLCVYLADQVGKAAGGRFGKAGGRLASAITSALVEFVVDEEVSENKYEMVYSIEIRPSEMTEDNWMPIDPDLPKIPGLLSTAVSGGPILGGDDYDPVFSIEVDDDHIGYQHNYAMYEIERNRRSYFINGEPDINSLLRDISDLTKCDGLDVKAEAAIKNIAQEIANVTIENYECGNTDEDLIWNYYFYLEEAGLSQEELQIFINFTAEISYKCLNMSADEIHNYAAQLHELIKSQNISADMKVELAIIAQCTVNSALFWQQ